MILRFVIVIQINQCLVRATTQCNGTDIRLGKPVAIPHFSHIHNICEY